MESIGVRELRQHASRWLARVEAGESFEITDRGRPVASLVPVAATDWDLLVASGAVAPASRGVLEVEPLDQSRSGDLSGLLAADREDTD